MAETTELIHLDLSVSDLSTSFHSDGISPGAIKTAITTTASLIVRTIADLRQDVRP
jgi:hypothetical protein